MSTRAKPNRKHALQRPGTAAARERLAAQQRYEFLNIAKKLIDQKQYQVCFEETAKILETDPSDPEMWNLFGVAAQHVSSADDAAMAFCRAVELKPTLVEAWGNLASLHASKGNIPGALKAYQAGLARKENPLVRGSMIFFMQRFVQDKQQVLEACLEYGRIYGKPSKVPFKNDRNPDRKLKIGYVSGDFCNHSVYYFIEPILRNHNHEQFEIHAFSMTEEDYKTEQLKPYFDHWHDVRPLNDQAMWQLVRDQRIDILVDLSGHTHLNRLPVFGMRAAPVQCTWIGNPGTTGLKEMDYRLYDIPENEQKYFTEKSDGGVHIWTPEPLAPEVAPSPYLENGHLTLGAFNDFNKVSDEVLTVWAQLLTEIPDAVLIIVTKDGSTPQFQARISGYFGPTADRLVFVERQPLQKYLTLFNLIDINLDPWPYNGGTTTYHAAWAGVPTVTLYTPENTASVGKNIVTGLGLPELAADTPEQYKQIIHTLNQNKEQLTTWRQAMRDRMRASYFMDYQGATRTLEALYKRYFRRWSETHT